MWKVLFKVSNAVNVKNKLLKDVPSVREFGIAPENVKLEIGQHIKLNVIKDQNNCNKCNRKLKINKKPKSQLLQSRT